MLDLKEAITKAKGVRGLRAVIDECRASHSDEDCLQAWESATGFVRTQGTRTASGPGTELKKLLSQIGIVPAKNCKCNKQAAYMDIKGPDWCETNIKVIVGWLRDEAKAQKLLFAGFAAEILIKQAIRLARRNAKP